MSTPEARAALSPAAFLDARTAAGSLYESLTEGKVRCVACGHRCVIFPGRRGICRLRFNDGGSLRVPWGYVAGLQCDPTEKKPFYHVLPGSTTLTFGMLGCSFHCPGCQNWVSSQTLRDPGAGVVPEDILPEEIVTFGLRCGARMVASSYNEPLITSEWAVAVFEKARQKGFLTGLVSNGYATPEVLSYLRPWCDCFKVDLKSMNARNYRILGGVLERVLEAIRVIHAMGFWMEIVTLVIPGWNDSDRELADAARFIASVSPDIPWHVTAFHGDYRMTGHGRTPAAALLRAARIGRAEGLRFIYAGNLPGQVGSYEHTCCPGCRTVLVERSGYHVRQNRLEGSGGRCPECGATIAGIWAWARA